jgi:hypothetical protein
VAKAASLTHCAQSLFPEVSHARASLPAERESAFGVRVEEVRDRQTAQAGVLSALPNFGAIHSLVAVAVARGVS